MQQKKISLKEKDMPEKKNKTKEQIAEEIKKRQVANHLRVKAKDELYPFLCDNSKNIEEAKVIAQAFYMSIEQAFMNLKKKMLVKELELDKMLNDTEDGKKYHKLFEMFNDETLEDMGTVVRDMPDVIDSFIRLEMKDRPLSSIKTYFLDPSKDDKTTK